MTDQRQDAVNHWSVAIEAVDSGDRVVADIVLAHGADPVTVLAERGWAVTDGVAVRQVGTELTITLRVRPQ
ncbi:MAG TPA: hypothetical protein GXZ60_05610, partial [Intrasporangiaceae bacterium]|nr:hypothetical protein [Intrasporangiaceae bacterium]